MEEFIRSIKPDTSPYDTFRDRVMRECLVSRQTFYNWEHGQSIEPKYKPVINRIALDMFGQKVFLDEPSTISCPDCPVAKFNACSKGVPCCRCSEESCNGRQPCPKEEEKRSNSAPIHT